MGKGRFGFVFTFRIEVLLAGATNRNVIGLLNWCERRIVML